MCVLKAWVSIECAHDNPDILSFLLRPQQRKSINIKYGFEFNFGGIWNTSYLKLTNHHGGSEILPILN